MARRGHRDGGCGAQPEQHSGALIVGVDKIEPTELVGCFSHRRHNFTLERWTRGRWPDAHCPRGQNIIDESISVLEDVHKVTPNPVSKAAELLKELSDKAPNNAQLLIFLGQAQLAQKKDQEGTPSG